LGRKREGRVSEKEAFKGAGGSGGRGLLDGGVEDVKKETREEEKLWREEKGVRK
jgi:hypothetical protein